MDVCLGGFMPKRDANAAHAAHASTIVEGTIRGPGFRLAARKSGRSESGEARIAKNGTARGKIE
jgi:hypothetical protein